MTNKICLLAGFLSLLAISCKKEPKQEEVKLPPSSATPVIVYRVNGIIPHNTSFFTEGLLFYNGKLLESTGSPEELKLTESVIATVDLATGKTEEKVKLDRSKFFGEGITVLNNKIYQVTYKNRLGFIYNAKTFKKEGEFTYANAEGWGMTTDGTHAIMSDGTDKLTFFMPPAMKPVKTLSVTESGVPVKSLNELEWIKGFIYANVWQTNYIVKINPNNGNVVAKMDLTALKYEADNTFRYSETLNGIAYDSVSNKIYVTGKLWPSIYRIEFAQ